MARRAARRTPHQTFRETPTTRVLPYPLTARINSTKQGQDTRILIAIEKFLDLLAQHPRVINLYTRWEYRYELYRLADTVHLYSIQLAKDLKLPDVWTLNQEAQTVDLSNLSDETRRWLDRREAAAVRFQQVIQNLPIKAMAQQARLVIKQLFVPRHSGTHRATLARSWTIVVREVDRQCCPFNRWESTVFPRFSQWKN